jgi:hypothetical protein
VVGQGVTCYFNPRETIRYCPRWYGVIEAEQGALPTRVIEFPIIKQAPSIVETVRDSLSAYHLSHIQISSATPPINFAVRPRPERCSVIFVLNQEIERGADLTAAITPNNGRLAVKFLVPSIGSTTKVNSASAISFSCAGYQPGCTVSPLEGN